MVVFLSVILTLGFVSAEFWACFAKGEVVNYCNNYKPDWTCGSSNGCQKCISVYNETANCYIHGVWPKCLQIPQECANMGGNTTIDTQPPQLTINNPIQDAIYNKRAVLLDLEVDEEATLTYMDNNDNRAYWKNICRECLSYNNSRSFKEGLNNITIKAEDVVGNTAYYNVGFFVDSKKPIIKKTEPRNNAYVNSIFTVTYYEDNPETVMLTYGNNITGYIDVELSGCLGGKRESCSVDVNLEDYDGEEVEYWFNITDIAGNSVKSRIGKVKVDISNPVLNYFNYTISGRYVEFLFNVTEINFDSIEHIDNSASRPIWRVLCSRLSDGICKKRKLFSSGLHNLDIQITDEAGNAIGFPVSFVI